MMDDDESGGSGLGGLAWYQVGRWHEEISQQNRRILAKARGCGVVDLADYNHVRDRYYEFVAENQRLSEALKRANTWLAQWHAKCDHLEAQAAKDAQRVADLEQLAQRLEAERDAAELEAEEFKMDIIAGKLIRVED